jgi:molybdenum cofactor biosynthesis enzyme MoaA
MMMSNFWHGREILKNKFDLIQINIGDMCNLMCTHCHVGASPKGVKNMDTGVRGQVLGITYFKFFDTMTSLKQIDKTIKELVQDGCKQSKITEFLQLSNDI